MMKKIVLTLLIALMALPFTAWAQEGTEDWVEFTSSDGTVTFSHPAEWVVEEDTDGRTFQIASSQATFDLMDAEENPVMPAGEFAFMLLFATDEEIAMLDETADPTSETYLADLAIVVSEYFLVEEVEGEATAEAVTTPEPAATTEPAAEGTPAADAPLIFTPLANDTYSIEFTETGFTVYGYDKDYQGNEGSVAAFSAVEGMTGFAIVLGSAEESDLDRQNALTLLQVLQTVVYTPAAE